MPFLRDVLLVGLLACSAVASTWASTPAMSEASAIYQRAEASFRARDLDTAAKLLTDALRLDPRNAEIRFGYGLVCFHRNEFVPAKENFEAVSRARPVSDRGGEYAKKLRANKKRIREMQAEFTKEALRLFESYTQKRDGKDQVKTAHTLYQAFRLCPPLGLKNAADLNRAITIYEALLKDDFANNRWQKSPMLQLAFLYETARRKDKASHIYMIALDHIDDPSESELITEKFDVINRSSRDRLLDLIEDGTFGRKDIQELMGSESAKLSDDESKRIDNMVAEMRARLESAETPEERERIFNELKDRIAEEQRKGLLPSKDQLNDRLKQDGKNIDDLLDGVK